MTSPGLRPARKSCDDPANLAAAAAIPEPQRDMECETPEERTYGGRVLPCLCADCDPIHPDDCPCWRCRPRECGYCGALMPKSWYWPYTAIPGVICETCADLEAPPTR